MEFCLNPNGACLLSGGRKLDPGVHRSVDVEPGVARRCAVVGIGDGDGRPASVRSDSAEAHGGTVTAANKAGGGAVVRVIIPAGAGVARG